ncbi:MAG TPA: acyl-CoA dehydrogenase family protein [Bacteroidia bacterium]|nr:acyl-CoA dehydrogenase family protein [Bacteroidia bacterium]
MNFELSQEQSLLQESLFTAARALNPAEPVAQRWRQIAATGIIGTCVAKEDGGSGLGAIELLLLLEALAEGQQDNGLSFAIAAHTLSCVIPISRYGSAEQKKKFLPGLINGSLIAANAMTESESGSDVFTLKCKADKVNGKYKLNGTKTFISNCAEASMALAYASTDASKGFFGGLTAFLVEEDKFEKGTSFKKMGLESCSLGQLHFNGVELANESVLGKEGGGAVIFNYSMEWERICLAGIHLGAMKRVLEKSVAFVKQRFSQGQSIGKYQGVSHALAEMKTKLEVSRQYAYHAARSLDQKKNTGETAAIAKLFISNSVTSFMQQAMQLFGGYGYIADYGIEQEVRDSLAATIYSGTSEIQKNIIASHMGI